MLPQTSRQAEVGLKWQAEDFSIDATLFEVQTRNEIAVATNAGGRASFQNVGSTQRRGLELATMWRVNAALRAQLALGVLQATYEDSFLACAGLPCAAATVRVPAGGRIAGAPRGNAYAEVAWTNARWGEWAAEVRATGRVAVNDSNTDFGAGYAVGALRWSKTVPLGGSGAHAASLTWLVRVDNVYDRTHTGSVIVNDANGRFFEPGAPRALLLALRFTGGF